MFFVQEDVYTPEWTNNWEIRVNWAGSFLNKPNKKPIPQLHYERKIYSDSFIRELAPLHPYFATINKQYNQLRPPQYYLEPFFLFSFFPQQSLKMGPVLKLYPGFKFINKTFKVRSFSLEETVKSFEFFWGASINDQFKKNCAFNWEKDVFEMGTYYRVKPERDKLFSYDAIRGLGEFDDALFNWKKPILLPLNCFKENEHNHIKIWWNVKDKAEQFISDLMSIRISFFYPKKVELSLNLKPDQETLVKFNYWYLITTKIGERVKIVPVQHWLIKLKTCLLSLYTDNQPFDSAWSLEYLPIQINYANWKLLLWHFDFKFLKSDLVKIVNLTSFLSNIDVESQSINSHALQKLKGKIAFQDEELEQKDLKIANFEKQPVDSLAIAYYKHFYNHIFTTKNSWDFQKEEWVNNSFAEHTFLSNWTKHTNKISLFSVFDWTDLIAIQFKIRQDITIQNNFFFQKLKLEKQDLNLETNDSIVVDKFVLPVDVLKKAAIEHLTFVQYWDWKTKWGEIYVKEDD